MGLLRRVRQARIETSDLREVARTVLPTLAEPGVRIGLDTRLGAGSMIVVEEDERILATPLDRLADEMTRAGVPGSPEGIGTALRSWVAARPVSDAAASLTGVAVLAWTDARRCAVGWQVLVCRGAHEVVWSPSPAARTDVVATRAAATERARQVPLELRVEGPVALWSHRTMPVLATAALAAPEQMMERLADGGLEINDAHVVITPSRPVACAGAGVAARLSGEATEASVTLSWERLPDLRWL